MSKDLCTLISVISTKKTSRKKVWQFNLEKNKSEILHSYFQVGCTRCVLNERAFPTKLLSGEFANFNLFIERLVKSELHVNRLKVRNLRREIKTEPRNMS